MFLKFQLTDQVVLIPEIHTSKLRLLEVLWKSKKYENFVVNLTTVCTITPRN